MTATPKDESEPAPLLSGAFARKELWKVDEFCEAFGTGKTRTFELLKTNELESVKIGASRRITRRSIEAWLARLPRTGGAS
jgi:excisionase family DNA binding protein